MSLSTALANGRDHDERARGHVMAATNNEEAAWCDVEHGRSTDLIRTVHVARLEWAMAVCALLAWVQVGGES